MSTASAIAVLNGAIDPAANTSCATRRVALQRRALPRLLAWLVPCGLGAFVLGARPAAALERYEGRAYATSGGALAYREIHWRYRQHGRPARLVVYRCPSGEPFARKRVWASGVAAAPDFELFDSRDGHREGVRSVDGQRQVYWQERDGAGVEQRMLAFGADAVVDAGFDALVRDRWAELRAGETIDAAFLLPSRQAFLDVRIEPVDVKATGDRTRLRMSLDAWYGFAAPATQLVYRTSDRWLLQFEGLGSIRDAGGEYLHVRIEFPPGLRSPDVSRAELEAAATMPLVGGCNA